jgi:hypothetical protein
VLCFASLAYALATGSGCKGIAVAVTAGVAVAAYLVDSLGQVVGWLEPFRVLSPFAWSTEGEPLRNGLDWTSAGVLLGASLVLAAIGTWIFERRDLAA